MNIIKKKTVKQQHCYDISNRNMYVRIYICKVTYQSEAIVSSR